MNHVSIDILKLYSQGNAKKWNEYLTLCAKNKDINSIARTLRELQIGMKELVSKGLNNDSISTQFVRWVMSLEKTAKLIIRLRNPMPQDNPLIAKDIQYKHTLEVKRKRDKELAIFLKESSY